MSVTQALEPVPEDTLLDVEHFLSTEQRTHERKRAGQLGMMEESEARIGSTKRAREACCDGDTESSAIAAKLSRIATPQRGAVVAQQEAAIAKVKVAELERELMTAQAHRARAVAQAADFQAAIELNQDNLKVAAKLCANIQDTCRGLLESLQMEQQVLAEMEANMWRAEQLQLQSLEEEVQATDRRCTEAKAAVVDAEAVLVEVEAQRTVSKAKLADFEGTLQDAEASMSKAEERLRQLQAKHQTVELHAAEAEAKRTLMAVKMATLQKCLTEAQQATAAISKERCDHDNGTARCNQVSGSQLAKDMPQKLVVLSQALPLVNGEYKLQNLQVNDHPAFCCRSGPEAMYLVWLCGIAANPGSDHMLGPHSGRHRAWAFIRESSAKEALEKMAGQDSVQLAMRLEGTTALSLQECMTAMPYEMARPGWWSRADVVHISIIPL